MANEDLTVSAYTTHPRVRPRSSSKRRRRRRLDLLVYHRHRRGEGHVPSVHGRIASGIPSNGGATERSQTASWVQNTLPRCETTEEEPCEMTVGILNVNSNSTGIGWDMLGLEDALSSLEAGLLPQPSHYDLACLVHKCRKERNRSYGLHLHAYICRTGLDAHPSLGNHLVSMLVEVGSMCQAQQVFDRLLYRNESAWNALLMGYIRCGESRHALILYQKMQEHESLHPYTIAALLKACAELKDLERGRKIHADIARKRLHERDVVVGNALVGLYAKCGSLAKAQEVFDKLPVRNVVSWNTLIAGYTSHGYGEEALKCFEQMQHDCVSPNAVTFLCSLKACGTIGATDKIRGIHAELSRKGLLETDFRLGSTLVDMYAKCGFLEKAQEVFDKLPVRDVVSWTALIAGYAEHGCGEEALDCLEQMKHDGISPNSATFVCSLKACGSIGATDKGQEMHAEISRKGLLGRDIRVGNALVDMYAKCGLLTKAQEVFDKLPAHNIITWTALIAGFAQLGESENVFLILDKMIGEGMMPNLVTFVSVLNACNHTGLVDEGQMYFEAMSKDYSITPTLEHHTCMVDLLGRAGQLEKAVAMIKKMRVHPDLKLWHTVLGACRMLGNVELGKQAFEHALRLDEKDHAAYVCMFNIYADADMQEDAKKVEAMRVEKQAWEKSSIVRLFLAGD